MIRFEAFEAWYEIFGQKQSVINSSYFTLNFGKITALSGLNGSGKTTFIKSILGLNPYTNGKVYYNKAQIKRGVRIGTLFNTGYTPEIMSNSLMIKVSDLFQLINRLTAKKVDTNSSYSLNNIINTFDLKEFRNISFDKLSKGTKKRVLIAVAILNVPEVIILDEPFEGLDKIQRVRLKYILNDIREKRLILISSHENLELNSMCDDFLVVENNQINKENNA